MDCSLPGSSVHGDSLGKNTQVGCHALLQGIFLTQESYQGFLHCRWILYQLSYQRSPTALTLPLLIFTASKEKGAIVSPTLQMRKLKIFRGLLICPNTDSKWQNQESNQADYRAGRFYYYVKLIQYYLNKGFPGDSDGKEPACSVRHTRDMVLILGQEDPLEKGMATYSNILPWKTPWTRNSSWEATVQGVTKESDITEQLSLSIIIY